MTDPRLLDLRPAEDGPPDLDRDAKIDELLLAGLEHYFGGRHEEAINVWGRVLFLDRGHVRARAYIERARGALAERQRKAEELVQEGVAALDRGDARAARRLLTSAMTHGDPHDLARTYLARLDRLSTPPPPGRWPPTPPSGAPPDAAASASLRSSPPRPVRALPIIAVAVLIGVLVVFAASRDLLRPLVTRDWRRGPTGAAVALALDPLPLPRPAEVALARARDLYRSGHLKPALAALDGVPEADPLAPQALLLRAELQGALLGSSAEPAASASEPPPPPAARPGEVRQ